MAQPMAAIIGRAARAVIIATFPRLSDRKLPNNVRSRAIRPLNRVFRTFLNMGQCSNVSFYAEIARKLLLGSPKLGLCDQGKQPRRAGRSLAPGGVFVAAASQNAGRSHF